MKKFFTGLKAKNWTAIVAIVSTVIFIGVIGWLLGAGNTDFEDLAYMALLFVPPYVSGFTTSKLIRKKQ